MGGVGVGTRMPPQHLDEHRQLDRRGQDANLAGAAQERLRAPGTSVTSSRVLQQERREQEALDAELDPPLEAEPARWRSGSATGWSAPPIE